MEKQDKKTEIPQSCKTVVSFSVSCDTCKFEKTWHNEKPCNTCDDLEKWTPKTER